MANLKSKYLLVSIKAKMLKDFEQRVKSNIVKPTGDRNQLLLTLVQLS